MGARKPCSVAGCGRTSSARGWCNGHYLRWWRCGNVKPEVPLLRTKRPCSVPDCERTVHARDLCVTHHRRLLKHGDPRPDIPIRVATGDGSLSHGYWKVPVPPNLRHLTNGETPVAEHRLVVAQH